MVVEGWVGRQLEYAVFFSNSCYEQLNAFTPMKDNKERVASEP